MAIQNTKMKLHDFAHFCKYSREIFEMPAGNYSIESINDMMIRILYYYLKGHSEIIAVTKPSIFIQPEIFAFW